MTDLELAMIDAEISSTLEELGGARRELHYVERAEVDGRVNDRDGWIAECARQRGRVAVLENELEKLQATLRAAEAAA